jgi:hypothetical protein
MLSDFFGLWGPRDEESESEDEDEEDLKSEEGRTLQQSEE